MLISYDLFSQYLAWPFPLTYLLLMASLNPHWNNFCWCLRNRNLITSNRSNFNQFFSVVAMLLLPMYIEQSQHSVLPLRFCEKVGFFLGTDKATAEGGTSLGGSGGMLARKIFENSKANRAILQHLGKNSLFFLCWKLTCLNLKGQKNCFIYFFPMCY